MKNKLYLIFFYVSLFVFVTGLCCFHLAPDNDLWARLIAGASIVDSFKILNKDFLSYTPTHIWYDHEWGASIFLYSALKYFGDSGLVFLKGILAFLTIFVCVQTVKLRKPANNNEAYNIFYYALMFLASFSALGNITRCLLFTCLFFAIFLYIAERARISSNYKILCLLPFVMLFWGNIHGGCISGIGLLGLYFVGEFLNKKPYKPYLYAAISCCVVLFFNPYGIEYVNFLFFAALMKRELIAEWQSSFIKVYLFQYIKYKIFLALMLFTQITYLIKNKVSYEKLDKTKLLVVAAVTVLSVLKVRHQAFFAFTAGTLLYNEFYTLVNSFFKFLKEKLNITNENTVKNIICVKNIIIYILIFTFSLPSLFFKSKEIRITESEYPRFAIEFIKMNNIKGNLLVNFNWGSYAAYKLYPNNLIFMDGRYEEVYDPDLLKQIRNFYLVKNDWNKVIRDYKTDILILEKKYPIYEKIKQGNEWTEIFTNNLSGVFVPSNKVQEDYIYPPFEDEYYNKTKFYTDIKFKLSEKISR